MSTQEKITWATRYIERGWPVFVLGRDKTPLPNCSWCKDRCPGRGNCICENFYCHGFYAATTDWDRIEQMILGAPDGMLAVRTGDGLCVLDFEGTEKGHETYDQFEQYTGGVDLPRNGLAQRTGGGGLHVVLNVDANPVRSRNRVLPDVDVKSAGGYIAVGPSEDGRGWLNDGVRMGWETDIPLATPEMLSWLQTTRGNFGGQGGAGGGSAIPGGDWYADALKNGCPGGLRDEFFNRLIFSLRKQGKTREQLESIVAEHWGRCQQVKTGAQWDMPWDHVKYKIERTWATVEPDEVPEWQSEFAQRRLSENTQKLNEGETVSGKRELAKVRKPLS